MSFIYEGKISNIDLKILSPTLKQCRSIAMIISGVLAKVNVDDGVANSVDITNGKVSIKSFDGLNTMKNTLALLIDNEKIHEAIDNIIKDQKIIAGGEVLRSVENLDSFGIDGLALYTAIIKEICVYCGQGFMKGVGLKSKSTTQDETNSNTQE